MNAPRMGTSAIIVQIIGAPIACKEGVKDSWREIADWASGQLKTRFDEGVQVKYYDLFDPACPSIPTLLDLAVHRHDVGSGAFGVQPRLMQQRFSGVLQRSLEGGKFVLFAHGAGKIPADHPLVYAGKYLPIMLDQYITHHRPHSICHWIMIWEQDLSPQRLSHRG